MFKKIRSYGLLYLLVGGLSIINVKAQQSPTYFLYPEATDFTWEEESPLSFTSLLEMEQYLRSWQQNQHQQAYWEASVDSLSRTDSIRYYATLHRGPEYRWAQLDVGEDIPPSWLRKAGYRPRLFRNRPLDHQSWLSIRDSLVFSAASNGFPFAAASLDSIRWQNKNQLKAKIKLEKGPFVSFTSPEVPENAQIRADFLAQYLGISPGEPYNERLVRRIGNRLRQLPYLRLKGNPKVSFQRDQATVQLPVERKPASRFDFIIGVLPGNADREELLVTGELSGELYNGFGRGERIALRFEQLRPQTQELAVAFEYPFLFNLPFGLSLEGDLYRRDTQFINLRYRAAGAYLWEGNNRLEVFIDRQQTNLLGFNEGQVLTSQRLPDTLDVARSFFGLQWQRETVDQSFNPSNGYRIQLSGAIGTRRIRRNGKILELGLAALYDSLTERSGQFNLSAQVATYWPLFSGTVLYLGADAASYFGSETLLANEQFRLGGARLLRGFDEQQIFASTYAVLTGEFRLLLGPQAFLYTFGDFAYVDARNQANPDLAADFPFGFGGGVNFSTRAGVFGFSLAVGKRSGEILDFGAPKVHFGYLSVF
ncbi:MAG: BamA/TamA family outer membrane protein [Bacteroidota bacterium]